MITRAPTCSWLHDDAHARYVEVLNASLRERPARDQDTPRRVTDDALIGDPQG